MLVHEEYGPEQSPAVPYCVARLGTGHCLADRRSYVYAGILASLGFHVVARVRDPCWLQVVNLAAYAGPSRAVVATRRILACLAGVERPVLPEL